MKIDIHLLCAVCEANKKGLTEMRIATAMEDNVEVWKCQKCDTKVVLRVDPKTTCWEK